MKNLQNCYESVVSKGRYNTASEVVRAALRLLEEEENRLNCVFHYQLTTPFHYQLTTPFHYQLTTPFHCELTTPISL